MSEENQARETNAPERAANGPAPPTVELDETQRAACELILSARVAVVTGGPGTGKTTTVRAALDQIEAREGYSYVLAAPTGKAARRMVESAGRAACTIHRLLGVQRGPDGRARWKFNPDNPLPFKRILIDEASMIDIELASALLSAIRPNKTQIVFIGDVNQLPSVGPGFFFGDLIESGIVPVARLTTVHRSKAASWICQQAPVILGGDVPDLAPRADFIAELHDAKLDAVDALIDSVVSRLPALGVPSSNIQVLAPMRRYEAGVDAINQRLQKRLNPSSEPGWNIGTVEVPGANGKTTEAVTIRPGDRVIQTSNDYELEVMNGEAGVVTEIVYERQPCPGCEGAGYTVPEDYSIEGAPDHLKKRCISCNGDKWVPPHAVVRFPDAGNDRVVRYPRESAYNLSLAFALTIHKSQGSEWPWVVVLCHSTHTRMLTRRILYTAITRGKTGVVLVGDESGIRRAVKNAQDGKRNTGLVDRMRVLIAKNEAARAALSSPAANSAPSANTEETKEPAA